ncbi:MAG: ATP-binding protein [Planctomycetota bacterium]
MSKSHQKTIRHRLIVFAVTTTGAALLSTGIATVILQWMEMRSTVPQTLLKRADIIGSSMAAALTCGDSTTDEVTWDDLAADVGQTLSSIGTQLSRVIERKNAREHLEQNAVAVQETNRALRDANEAAQTAAEAKDEFLANISHELRTPLNGIVGFTQLMKETGLSAQQRDFTQTVEKSADSLLALVNELLDYSSLAAGTIRLDQSELSIVETVNNVVAALRTRASAKQIAVDARIDPQIPDRVIGDERRIRQVLTNLTQNAIKYTDLGKVVVAASVEEIARDSLSVIFAIDDTGIGIPADQQQAIFESFTEVDDASTRRFDGTGLGLSVTRRLVDLLGGKISLKSELGKGSTFSFGLQLPVASVTGHTGCQTSGGSPGESELNCSV